jgi:hypothetical protein
MHRDASVGTLASRALRQVCAPMNLHDRRVTKPMSSRRDFVADEIGRNEAFQEYTP